MKRIIAGMVCVLLFLTGCSLSTATVPDTRSETEIEQDIAVAEKVLDSLITDVTFEKDIDGEASIVYTGESTEISVTDDSGLTWTLRIPAHALPEDEDYDDEESEEKIITMVPLKNVKDAYGNPKAGVLFEPDGMEFDIPAELIITGPQADRGLLFYADHEGKGLSPAVSLAGKEGISAQVAHFSTAVLDRSTGSVGNAEREKVADESYNDMVPKAEKLLKKKIKEPKIPKLELECLKEKQLDKVGRYIENYMKEELTYLSGFLILYMHYQNIDNTSRTKKLLPIMEQLLERYRTKWNYIAPFDQLKPETYFYIMASHPQYYIYIGFEVTLASLGDSGEDPDKIAVNALNNIAASGVYSWNYLMENIRTKHNYRLIYAAILAHRFFEVDSDGAKSLGKGAATRFEELQKACTFKISFTGSVTADEDKGKTTWSTEGEALVTFAESIPLYSSDTEYILEGTGTGEHTNYSSTVTAMVERLLTKEFSTRMLLIPKFPCFEDVEVGICNFGSEDELIYEDDGKQFPVPSFFGWLSSYVPDHFHGGRRAAIVEMELDAGETRCEEEIDDGEAKFKTEYTITLEHMPQ